MGRPLRREHAIRASSGKCGLHVVAESKQDYYPLIDRHYDRVYRIITAGEWRDAEHRQMARMIA